MDYYPAGSLDAVLRSRAFRRRDSREAARGVGAELAAALRQLHAFCVVHRDVKPSNVLVDDRGHARLSDFGLATRLPKPDGVVAKRSFAGTVNYAAPELLKRTATTFGAAVDCWALGCLIYEMLEGRTPFEAETARETFSRIVEDRDPAWPADADADALSTMRHFLARDPKARLTAAESVESPWFGALDFAALDGKAGPLAAVAAVLAECDGMESDDADAELHRLFRDAGPKTPEGGSEGFAGFSRPESESVVV
mmetsp:Transcript_3525/g.10647  ORF Transcript_3525/g.10647 Transcript_3525/m.10647 type:complete len:254 (-) Transcript_3525:28-789(-)